LRYKGFGAIGGSRTHRLWSHRPPCCHYTTTAMGRAAAARCGGGGIRTFNRVLRGGSLAPSCITVLPRLPSTPCGTRTRFSALKGRKTNPYPNEAWPICAASSGLEPELPGSKIRRASDYPTRQGVSWLTRQDSNLNQLTQNQPCYLLHHGSRVRAEGFEPPAPEGNCFTDNRDKPYSPRTRGITSSPSRTRPTVTD
jgi:hypothetical protein